MVLDPVLGLDGRLLNPHYQGIGYKSWDGSAWISLQLRESTFYRILS